jgi:predicted Ser/Thr protein kinase
LNAQEAGQQAGVAQALREVVVKRGYMAHGVARQLDQARELAERSRHAKLSVQLLLRHGRPAEEVLRAYYEELKQQGFPRELGQALVADSHLQAEEAQALGTAVGRAWEALYQREARELGDGLRAATAAGPGAGAPFGAMPGQAPMGAPPMMATGLHAAYPGVFQTGMMQAYQPYGGYPGYGYNGGYAMAPVPPTFVSGIRPAFSGGYEYGPMPGGPPPVMAQPIPPGQALPPSPSPWGGAPVAPPGSGPVAPGYQSALTSERVARMDLLPAWAHTRERSAARLDAPSSGPLRPPPEVAAAGEGASPGVVATPDGVGAAPGAKPKKLRKLDEPKGTVPGFEYMERLGKGKVGVVYKARELASGREVALKVLLPVFMEEPSLVERFLREAQIAASLEHTNIRKVYAGGQAAGLLYLVMEYIDGETLQDKLDRDGKLPEDDCLRWAAQIARAMDHYNRHGVLHRDIKPANILISNDRRALLCDLGISKRVYEDFALTKQGTTLGSPFYISPEQGMGTDDLDIRSDLYSLGVTLFHCLAGRVPFYGQNAGVIISKHAREPLPDLKKLNPEISPQSVELVAKMCAKLPEDRPQSPKQLLAELQWIRTEVGGGINTPIAPLEPPGEDSLEEMAVPKPRLGLWRRFLRALGIGR